MSTAHVHESAADIAIELELPDVDPEGFGKRPAGSSTFHRELQLPPSADTEHLSATLRRSVLELHAPKRRPRPRRIPVRVPCRLNGSACAD